MGASTRAKGWVSVVEVQVVGRVSLHADIHNMRTNIEIDDKLMKAALRATGAKTKREAVELGLKTLVQLHAQEKA